MTQIVSKLISGGTILGVLSLILFTADSCSQRSTALKEACMKAGGSVIVIHDEKFHCVMGRSV